MYRGLLQTIRLLAGLYAVAGLSGFALILTWLVGTGGFAICGQRMLDGPFWPLGLALLSLAPVGTVVGAVVLFVICSKRLSQPAAE